MIQIGGINIADAVLNNEMRIAVLEKLVEHLINGGRLDPQTIERFRNAAVSELQQKYPDAGITRQ